MQPEYSRYRAISLAEISSCADRRRGEILVRSIFNGQLYA